MNMNYEPRVLILGELEAAFREPEFPTDVGWFKKASPALKLEFEGDEEAIDV
jgi:hypothetical protein